MDIENELQAIEKEIDKHIELRREWGYALRETPEITNALKAIQNIRAAIGPTTETDPNQMDLPIDAP